MSDSLGWMNATLPDQEQPVYTETMEPGFNPFSYGNLASMFNIGMGNIGGGGDNYQWGFDNSNIPNLIDQGYSFQGRYGDQGENGYYGQMLKDGKVVDTKFNSLDDPFFGALIDFGVGSVLGGAPFLGGGGGLAGTLGYGGGSLGGAINGAATGGLISAGNGQGIGRGLLSGGLGGFAGGSNFAKDLGVTNPIASAAVNRGIGATVGAIAGGADGGDAARAGLTGGLMGGITQGLNSMGDGFSNFWNNLTGGGQSSLPGLSNDPAQNASYPADWQPGGQVGAALRQDLGTNYDMSYAPPSSSYGNGNAYNLPQPQQEVGQKQATSFSMPSMGNVGNFLGNNAGNLASMLYGFYNNRKQQNALNGQMNNLQGMFGQNSPYAAQLRNKLMAQAAQRGTRSNVAGREVQLQAALAQNAAGLAPSLYNMQNAKNGLQNNQMNMILQGGRLLGPGLAQLFGQQPQQPAFQADSNTMGDLW